MSEHMTAWLGAYMDDELHGRRLRQVEEHLASCAACGMELDALRYLSGQLNSIPPASLSLSPERFAAQVILQLPPQPARSKPQAVPVVIWWLLPAALFLGWAFIYTSDTISNLLNFLLGAGLLGNTGGWIITNASGTDLFSSIIAWVQTGLAGLGWFSVRILGDAELFLLNKLFSLIPIAVMSMLLWGWLAGWWVYHRQWAENNN